MLKAVEVARIGSATFEIRQVWLMLAGGFRQGQRALPRARSGRGASARLVWLYHTPRSGTLTEMGSRRVYRHSRMPLRVTTALPVLQFEKTSVAFVFALTYYMEQPLQLGQFDDE